MNPKLPQDVEALARLFDAHDWRLLHVKTADFELRLSKDADEGLVGAVPAGIAAPASRPRSSPLPGADKAPVPRPTGAIPPGLQAITAPNLGTFYRAPKPGAEPYVEIGQRIEMETEVCLIEVMKLFTTVRAGLRGVIREICVEDGALVEHGQPLFLIAPEA